MAVMPSTAEGAPPPPNLNDNPTTVDLLKIDSVVAINTVNAQVTPSSSVLSQTSDRPFQTQQN